MKIRLEVEIDMIADDFIDEPQWLLENSVSNGNIENVRIIKN